MKSSDQSWLSHRRGHYDTGWKAGSLVDLQLCDTFVKHNALVAAPSAVVSEFLKPVCLDQPDGHLRIRITVL